eukprot:CAMPEP_0179454400 /NCGR_PEP_ID=MMETSP0799-20121207/38243_1 /TAXON_ID=46947 /ORGANISM="Geminigera cryophila, Strain CCMP2564" /LENGTH=116 /DNA_ID=CAMNT_0021252199 /DNA_START=75 /DNA_END=423 /DNA_ORIENTATION=-
MTHVSLTYTVTPTSHSSEHLALAAKSVDMMRCSTRRQPVGRRFRDRYIAMYSSRETTPRATGAARERLLRCAVCSCEVVRLCVALVRLVEPPAYTEEKGGVTPCTTATRSNVSKMP